MSWYGALIRALDLAVVLNITVLIGRYLGPLRVGWRDDPDGYAHKLMLGIVVGWSGSWLLYANLAYLFWLRDADPSASLASPAVRLAYLSLTLLGTSMHIAASMEPRPFWPATARWCAALAAGTGAVWALELWPPTTWRHLVPWLALTKAFHIAVAVESLAIAALYAGPLWAEIRADPRSRTGHFIGALVAAWASNALCFLPLLYGYAVDGAQPRSVPGLPDELRVLYLAGFLTSGAYFMAAARGGHATLWRRFWVWSALMAAVMAGALAWLGIPHAPA